MNKMQPIDQSVQRFTVNTGIESQGKLMDNEFFFTKRHTNANGSDIFYLNNKYLAHANIKFKKIAKFEEFPSLYCYFVTWDF